jgi:hypothetical protein
MSPEYSVNPISLKPMSSHQHVTICNVCNVMFIIREGSGNYLPVESVGFYQDDEFLFN